MLDQLPFDLMSLREAYANGVRPEAVIDEIFARLDTVSDPGIFIHLCDRESLKADAAALGDYDPKQPLWGSLWREGQYRRCWNADDGGMSRLRIQAGPRCIRGRETAGSGCTDDREDQS